MVTIKKIISAGLFLSASSSLFGMQWFDKHISKKVSSKIVSNTIKKVSSINEKNPLFIEMMSILLLAPTHSYYTEKACSKERISILIKYYDENLNFRIMINSLINVISNELSRSPFIEILTRIPYIQNIQKKYDAIPENEINFFAQQFLVKEYTQWISKNPERQDILLKDNDFADHETIQNFYNYDLTTNMAIFLHENYQLSTYIITSIFSGWQWQTKFKKYPLHIALPKMVAGGIVLSIILSLIPKIIFSYDTTTDKAIEITTKIFEKNKKSILDATSSMIKNYFKDTESLHKIISTSYLPLVLLGSAMTVEFSLLFNDFTKLAMQGVDKDTLLQDPDMLLSHYKYKKSSKD